MLTGSDIVLRKRDVPLVARPDGVSRQRALTWVPVPAELLRDLRSDGFFVDQLTGYYAVYAGEYNLLRLRVTAAGTWEAMAAGNSGFGRTAAFKERAPLVQRQIQQALASARKSGNTVAARSAAKSGRTQLGKAARTFKPKPKRTRRTYRSMFVQGGAPGLGRRA